MSILVDEIGKRHAGDGTLLMSCVAGSRLYGLDTPSSDMDIRGIYMDRVEDLLNVCGKMDSEQSDERGDTKYYGLHKFLKLASECNPNMVELLAVPASRLMFCSPSYSYLSSHIGWFMSTRAMRTFSGYAYAQIQKSKGANRKANQVARRVDRDGLRFAWSVIHSSDEIRKRAFGHVLCRIPAGFGPDDVERMTCSDFVRYLSKLDFEEKDLSEFGYDAFLKMRRPRQTEFMYRYEWYDQMERKPLFFEPSRKELGGCISSTGFSAAQFDGVPDVYVLRRVLDGRRFVSDDDSGILVNFRPGDNDMPVTAIARFDSAAYEREHREYLSFWEWMANRNESRCTADWNEDGMYDAKSMMHAMRLLMSAEHIAENGVPRVVFEGEDRDRLMSIREGRVPYPELLAEATERMDALGPKFDKSGLPHSADVKSINAWYVNALKEAANANV